MKKILIRFLTVASALMLARGCYGAGKELKMLSKLINEMGDAQLQQYVQARVQEGYTITPVDAEAKRIFESRIAALPITPEARQELLLSLKKPEERELVRAAAKKAADQATEKAKQAAEEKQRTSEPVGSRGIFVLLPGVVKNMDAKTLQEYMRQKIDEGYALQPATEEVATLLLKNIESLPIEMDKKNALRAAIVPPKVEPVASSSGAGGQGVGGASGGSGGGQAKGAVASITVNPAEEKKAEAAKKEESAAAVGKGKEEKVAAERPAEEKKEAEEKKKEAIKNEEAAAVGEGKKEKKQEQEAVLIVAAREDKEEKAAAAQEEQEKKEKKEKGAVEKKADSDKTVTANLEERKAKALEDIEREAEAETKTKGDVAPASKQASDALLLAALGKIAYRGVDAAQNTPEGKIKARDTYLGLIYTSLIPLLKNTRFLLKANLKKLVGVRDGATFLVEGTLSRFAAGSLTFIDDDTLLEIYDGFDERLKQIILLFGNCFFFFDLSSSKVVEMLMISIVASQRAFDAGATRSSDMVANKVVREWLVAAARDPGIFESKKRMSALDNSLASARKKLAEEAQARAGRVQLPDTASMAALREEIKKYEAEKRVLESNITLRIDYLEELQTRISRLCIDYNYERSYYLLGYEFAQKAQALTGVKAVAKMNVMPMLLNAPHEADDSFNGFFRSKNPNDFSDASRIGTMLGTQLVYDGKAMSEVFADPKKVSKLPPDSIILDEGGVKMDGYYVLDMILKNHLKKLRGGQEIVTFDMKKVLSDRLKSVGDVKSLVGLLEEIKNRGGKEVDAHLGLLSNLIKMLKSGVEIQEPADAPEQIEAYVTNIIDALKRLAGDDAVPGLLANLLKKSITASQEKKKLVDNAKRVIAVLRNLAATIKKKRGVATPADFLIEGKTVDQFIQEMLPTFAGSNATRYLKTVVKNDRLPTDVAAFFTTIVGGADELKKLMPEDDWYLIIEPYGLLVRLLEAADIRAVQASKEGKMAELAEQIRDTLRAFNSGIIDRGKPILVTGVDKAIEQGLYKGKLSGLLAEFDRYMLPEFFAQLRVLIGRNKLGVAQTPDYRQREDAAKKLFAQVLLASSKKMVEAINKGEVNEALLSIQPVPGQVTGEDAARNEQVYRRIIQGSLTPLVSVMSRPVAELTGEVVSKAVADSMNAMDIRWKTKIGQALFKNREKQQKEVQEQIAKFLDSTAAAVTNLITFAHEQTKEAQAKAEAEAEVVGGIPEAPPPDAPPLEGAIPVAPPMDEPPNIPDAPPMDVGPAGNIPDAPPL